VVVLSAGPVMKVTSTYPAEGGQIGALGRVGASFSLPLQMDLTVQAFSLEPVVDGRIVVDGTRVWFLPVHALQPGVTYTARLRAGILSQGRSKSRQELAWTFSVRPAQIVYYVLGENGGEVWRRSLDGSPAVQITHTQEKVSDYSASLDGEWIAYLVTNASEGADLWICDRDGGNSRLLVACGKDLCTLPSWSSDAARLAFSRSARRENGGYDTPRLWTAGLLDGKVAPLYQDTAVQGSESAWSPDGNYLASFDPAANAIRVLNLKTSQETLLTTTIEQAGRWTPDGQQLYYLQDISTENGPVGAIYAANIPDHTGKELMADSANRYDFSLPDISPDGSWLVVGFRQEQSSPNKQLWLMHPDGSEARPITTDQLFTYAGYHWDPWSRAVVFQGFQIGLSAGRPDVFVWQASTNTATLVAENGALPAWLP